MNPSSPRVRWGPDTTIGVAFGVLAFGEAIRQFGIDFGGLRWSTLINCLVVGWSFSIAAGLHRRSPAVALALVWLGGAYQLFFGVQPMLTEIAVTVVAYGCGRWGTTRVLWISGISMPLAGIAAYGVFAESAASYGIPYARMLVPALHSSFWQWANVTNKTSAMALAAVGCGVMLFIPWLLGITLRFRQRADVTEVARQEAVHDAEQAQQIAELKEQQADLARDVHDVVGHSLAVILAQAEAAQFRDDADHESLKQSMRDIADAARTSLRDVRNVLSRADDSSPQTIGSLDSLIDGVRASGQEIKTRVVGTPRPLPPELDVVSYRVLQEMLTNAIKHGVRNAPVNVTRDWSQGLRIEVANESVTAENVAGQGLNGMRRRVDAIGGTVTVQHEGNRFVATARIPLRPA